MLQLATSQKPPNSGKLDKRGYQRICWKLNPDEKLICCKLNTATYGTASALYLADKYLRQMAKEIRDCYRFLSKIVAKDFYIDDLVTVTDSLKES
ncbi:hypothetical protein Trydic_g19748 [Trypoxylus dichotomus]